ncbi:beta strand repeat-containing protein [Spirosoma litoris]
MKQISTPLFSRGISHCLAWATFLLVLCLGFRANAQQSNLGAPNSTTSTPWVSPTFSLSTNHASPGLSCWGGDALCASGGDPANVTNSTLTDYDELGILISGAGSFTVGDNNPANIYDAGNFAGFLISNSSLADVTLLGAVTITTYKNGVQREQKTAASLIGINSALVSGAYEVGFHTTLDFNQISIAFTNPLTVATSYRLYYALMRRYASASTPLVCNTPSSLTAPGNSIFISDRTGVTTGATCALCSVSNGDNIIDGNSANSASINLTAGVAVTATIGVKNAFITYPASQTNTFVGFDISSTDLVSLGVNDKITVSTYKTGTAAAIQSVTYGGNLVAVGSAILSGTGRRTIGFVATADFDEVVLTVTRAVSAVDVGINVFGVVMTSFCNGPSLACSDNTIPGNTLTPVTNPTHPVYVDGARTGIVGGVACAACQINNSENVVDASTTNSATMVVTAGVAVTASFAVANALQTYPVGSFAGFDVETNSLLSANVFSTATVRLYNDGNLVQTSTGNALIVGAASSPLLNNRSRQYLGVVATAPYDEIQISFVNVVGADLGNIVIYNAVFEKTCAAVIVCNTAYNLSSPTFPVVIDNANTGVTGVVSAATTVENPWNVVSSSTTDYAKINTTASVGTVASIAVLDPISTYPVGTFAGFAVQKVTGIAAVDLFANLTISTYNNGTFVESRSGVGLLDLAINLFGTTSQFFNVGFVTTKPFDEVKISVRPLVGIAALSALGGSLNVFGAFIDTRTTTGGGLTCALNTNPDFAVTNKNVPVSGSVKTNDIVPVGTTYGTSPTTLTQPAGSTPSLTVDANGNYTFSSATPGVYVYSIPVCGSGLSGTGCATQTLTITVLDPTVNANKPVVNPDVVSMLGSDTSPSPVTINVKVNDGPGNPGGTLGTPTIATGPASGTATVDGSGNVVYTPAAGFYGTDKFTYTVCETPGTSLCASTTVTVTVSATGTPNSTLAADDYISTYQSTSVAGNVKTNDSDPEGNTQTITTQNTTIPGIGTLVLAADGSYTFTPVAGATGPVDFSYTTTDNGSPNVSASGTLHILINPFNPNPDFAVTNINVPVPGSVKTNDVVPVGTTYGPTPTLTSSPGGSTPSLVFTSTGSYTFTTGTPGVYTYSVPVCVTGTPPVCTTQTLTITVSNTAITTNNPIANPDFATTTGSPTSPTAITVNVKANDGPGNKGGVLQNPTVPVQPAHGSATIDGSGNLVYTPTAGYYGTDIVTYVICETPSTPACGTATVTITVKAPNSPATVSINDDYVATAGTSVSGNVITNDLGTGLSVSNTGTTVVSSGTLVLTSTGSFTFTPAPGVTGPVDFTYTACDNNTPSTCGNATLHVLVNLGLPDLTPTITMPQANFGASPNNVRNFVVNIQELAGIATSSGNVVITLSVPTGYTISYSNAITSIDVTDGATTNVDNTKWSVTASNSVQITLTINAGQFIAANATARLGFTATRTTANTGSISNITVNVANDLGTNATLRYDGNPLNNVYARIIAGI